MAMELKIESKKDKGMLIVFVFVVLVLVGYLYWNARSSSGDANTLLSQFQPTTQRIQSDFDATYLKNSPQVKALVRSREYPLEVGTSGNPNPFSPF